MAERFASGHALLIGVGRTRNPAWSLPASVEDVRALAAVLTDSEHCGYPPGQVVSLTDAEATRAHILGGLAELARRSAAHPALTVFVYYSGHGWLKADEDRYFLIPHEIDPDDPEATALPAGELTEALRGIRSARLLVALDTCHAAGMAEAKEAGAPPRFRPHSPPKGRLDRLLDGGGRAVLSSCRGSQKSWIFPGGLSVFTHHLVEALRGGHATAGRDTVRLLDVLTHVSARVEASAHELGHRQTPYFKIDADDFPVALVPRRRRGKGLPGATDTFVADEILRPEGVRESWDLVFDAFRAGDGTAAPPLPDQAVAAGRQILDALSVDHPEPHLEDGFWQRLRTVREEGVELESAEGLARLYLEIGHLLSSDGRFEAAFQARRLCRRFLDRGMRQRAVSESLRALQDGLVNCEAVAMRDEFQPRLADHQLAEYDNPRRRALLYPQVCVLGTRAQLLTYLAEIGEDRELARERLDEAESLLKRVIAYLETSSGHRSELPRDHNYLGAVHAAAGDLEAMDASLEEALRSNDRWFDELSGEERRRSVRDTWIANTVFTYQIWLRSCDLHGDDERFARVDRRHREHWLRVAAATGRWDEQRRWEQRFPAALVRRYRARTWARALTGVRGSEIWRARVVRPLLDLHRLFDERAAGDLAAALLVDLLLLAEPQSPDARTWARRLEELLSSLARNSRRHWGDRSLYREPFARERERLQDFDDGRLPLPDLRRDLHRLRAVLAY